MFEFNKGQKIAIDLAYSFCTNSYTDFLKEYQETKEKCLKEDPKYFDGFFIGTIEDPTYFGVQGAAGTGKTSIATGIVDQLHNHFLEKKPHENKKFKPDVTDFFFEENNETEVKQPYIMGAALSHAAKQVLQSKLSKNKVIVSTIASYLKMQPKVVDGKEIFKPLKIYKGDPRFDPFSRVEVGIYDEGSMLGPTILNRTKELGQAYRKNIRYICLLDPYQLPPIEEKEEDQGLSPLCDVIGVRLTEIMRYNGKIAEYCESIKKMIDDKILHEYELYPKVSPDDNVSLHRSKADLISSVLSKIEEQPSNPYHVRVGAYRNAVVNDVNRVIRENRFGKEAKPWEKGDWLVLNDISLGKVILTDELGEITKVDDVYNNGEFFIVKRVLSLQSYHHGVPCIQVWCSPVDKPQTTVEFQIPTDSKEVKKLLQEVAQCIKTKEPDLFRLLVEDLVNRRGKYFRRLRMKDWGIYWEVKKSFGSCAYGYAMTLHKLQGSTINHQWVILRDVLSLKALPDDNKLRGIYVGNTRAKEHLYLMT